MINVQDYYKKLADQAPISEQEIRRLLKSYETAIGLAAYLADCHAATAETLPAQAPLSAKKRMRSICEIAVKGLDGNFDVYCARKPADVQDRCRKVNEELSNKISAQEADTAKRASERKASKAAKATP